VTNVVLATSSAAVEQRVRRALGPHQNGTLRRWHDEIMLTDPSRAVKELVADGAEVIGIGPDIDLGTALALSSAFDASHPEIAVVLIAEPDKSLWQRAMRAGVNDVLTTRSDDEEIKRVFDRVAEAARRRKANLLDEIGEPTGPSRIITLVAPKGGVGKTALATNLAVALSGAQRKVVLVDLDLQFGDVAGCLSLKPENTIRDLAAAPDHLGHTALKVFLTPATEDLFVLCAPESPAEGEEVDDRAVERAIRLVGGEFDQVVVDTSAGLSEPTLAAVELSTDLVFMCDLSAAAVRSLRKVIDALDRLGVDEPRRHFILNRADSRVGIEVDEAAAVVGLPVSGQIPSDRAVPLSMNRGEPLVTSSPKSAVARSYLAVAELFREEPAVSMRRGRSTR
jgi:pilus assembly protein CpaE